MAPNAASVVEAPPPPSPDARVNAILEIATTLGGSLNLGDLLEGVMLKLARLLGAERSTLYLIDREHHEVWTRVPRQGVSFEVRLPLGQGLAGHVAQTGEALNVADAYADSRFHAGVDRATGFHTRAVLAVPVQGKDGSIVGVVQALNKVGGFTAEDVRTLDSISSLVGLSVENARLYTDVRRQNERLQETQDHLRQKVAQVDLLLAIEREVSNASSLDTMLAAVLTQAMNTFGGRAVSVLLVDGSTSELHLLRAAGEAVTTSIVPTPSSHGVLKKVLAGGEPILAHRNDGAAGALAELAGLEWKSTLCARLADSTGAGHDRVIGAIEWVDPTPRELTADARALAQVVADQISHAVKLCRARLANERTTRLAALGQMLGGLVHDMRSPMTVIGGYAELLSRESEVSVRDRYSQHILSQLDYVNTMTRDVLAFIRGERQILTRRVQMSSFWQEVLPVLTRELTPHGIELRLQIDYTGGARFDESKLKRIVTNLARNAAQAMTSGGEFKVSCKADGETLILGFADNGPGLPPHVASRLFTAFNSHGKQGGTGLGLALVKEIAEAHGGQVTCTTSPEHGTAFELTLPHAVLT